MKIAFNPYLYTRNLQYYKRSPAVLGDSKKNETKTPPNCREIYAFNLDGTYVKYPSISEAARQIGATHSNICDVLAHRSNLSNGHNFAYAQEVEYKNKDGEAVVDKYAIEAKVSELIKAADYIIFAFKSDGTIEAHKSYSAIKENIGISDQKLCDVLTGKAKISKGYTFERAKNLYLKDENGNYILDSSGKCILDETKVNKVRERFLYSPSNFPIITLDENFNVKIYNSIKKLAEEKNIPLSSVSRALAKQKNKIDKCVVAKLADVVKKDNEDNVVYNPDGTCVLDYSKLEMLHQNYLCKRKKENAN